MGATACATGRVGAPSPRSVLTSRRIFPQGLTAFGWPSAQTEARSERARKRASHHHSDAASRNGCPRRRLRRQDAGGDGSPVGCGSQERAEAVPSSTTEH